MGWGLSHAGSIPQVAPVTQRKVAASLSARWWKLWRITGERLDSLTARFEGSDSSGLTPSEVLQMLEPSSRHWCDWDVNEQLEDYYAILTWPDEDSAEEPSAWPLMSDSVATTIRMTFRELLSIA